MTGSSLNQTAFNPELQGAENRLAGGDNLKRHLWMSLAKGTVFS